jgi:phospholipid/cholesterol/gamma-HCH transport system substrate-binding protein
MESRAHALVAGLFVIVLSGVGVAALWWFGGKHEATSSYYLVTQRALSGLNPQAQVRYRGIRAGKVEDILLDPVNPRNILVRISLDSAIRLTRGSTAQLANQGVTGLAYVMLDDSGDNSEPLRAEQDDLPRIPLRPGLLETLAEQSGNVVSQLAAISNRANRLFDERNLNNVARTIDNLATASDGLKEVPALVAQMKRALSDENMKNLQRILAHVEQTLGQTAPLAAELRGLVTTMQSLAQRVDGIAGDVGTELRTRTLPEVELLSQDMQRTNRQLQRVLEQIEQTPQSLLFGRPAPSAGPGEASFAVPH